MKINQNVLSTLLVTFVLITAVGCTNRAPSLRMLDSRAEYDDPRELHGISMKEGGIEGFRNHPVPVRSRPKVAAIWVHPHETASRDYFWGGWLSCVVEQDQWVLAKPNQTPNAPGIVDVTQGPPQFGNIKKVIPQRKPLIKSKPPAATTINSVSKP